MALAPEDATQLPTDGTCDACEPDEACEALVFCDDCGFAFCEFHANKHAERFAGHRVRGFSQPSPAEPTAATEELTASAEEPGHDTKENEESEKKKCPLHNQELTLYCREDEKIICVLCAVAGDHRQHQLITLNEAYQQMKNRKPVDLKLAMGDMVEKLKVKCADPRVSRSELKSFIQKEFDHMRDLVQEEEKRALHFVDLQEAMASAHVTEVLAELNVHMGKLMTEMAEITRQLNSFNQMANEKSENPEEDSREKNDSAPEGSSGSRMSDPPPGNGPW
ncbi:tripartite motif-containing protein 44 isoform X2 [Spea bombifrons]|uniref:tripartite motif-containing protein 44 isoform X2 n=1 Tax=Spea bombifrons TaxID=233779 RepID=UPI002349475C|nr:tripartite motif-containing protein 44 isoform X2 [Spea bombifrons]